MNDCDESANSTIFERRLGGSQRRPVWGQLQVRLAERVEIDLDGSLLHQSVIERLLGLRESHAAQALGGQRRRHTRGLGGGQPTAVDPLRQRRGGSGGRWHGNLAVHLLLVQPDQVDAAALALPTQQLR